MNENSNQNEIVQSNEVLTMEPNGTVIQENVVQNNNMAPKKSNKGKVIIVLILLIVFVVGGIIVWKSFGSNTIDSDNNNDDSNSKTVDNNTNDKNKNDDKKYSIVLYRSEDGYCLEQDLDCNEGSVEVSVKHKDAKFERVVNLEKHFAIYTDAYVYLYDIDDEESTKLGIDPKDYNYYDFVVNNKTNKVIGIFCGYLDKDSGLYYKTAFYNIYNEKLLYENKYYNYEVVGNGYLSATLQTGSGDTEDDFTQYLLNQNKEEVLISKVGEGIKYRIEKSGNYYIIIESTSSGIQTSSTVYTKDKKTIFRDVYDSLWSIDEDGNVFVSNEDIVKKYNYSGITLKTSKNLHNVLHLIMNYALTINADDKLTLINIDSNKEYELIDWQDEYYYYIDKSGYMDSSSGRDAGIYIVLGMGDGTDSTDETIVKYYFDPKTNELTKITDEVNDLEE